jgi:hypothetical protein
MGNRHTASLKPYHILLNHLGNEVAINPGGQTAAETLRREHFLADTTGQGRPKPGIRIDSKFQESLEELELIVLNRPYQGVPPSLQVHLGDMVVQFREYDGSETPRTRPERGDRAEGRGHQKVLCHVNNEFGWKVFQRRRHRHLAGRQRSTMGFLFGVSNRNV